MNLKGRIFSVTYHSIFLTLLCLTSIEIRANDLVINEFLSNNQSSIKDIDGDREDWIEIYNNSSVPIQLGEYFLSDDVGNLMKWKFPNMLIQAQEFVTVFASGKDRLDTTELHCNFKIKLEGEALFLSKNGIIIDQTPSTELFNDESYGRVPDGSGTWVQMSNPSFNLSNNSQNHVIFSHTAGFYPFAISLDLTSALGDTIYYTMDGSVPDENSLSYSIPILLNDRSSDSNYYANIPTCPEELWIEPSELVDKINVLRCASYSHGVRTSAIYTKSYFIDSTIFGKYSMPVISLVTEEANLFGADSGIYVPGITYDSIDPFHGWTGNYYQGWEKPVHIEFFNNRGTLEFSQNAGVQIHGGATRRKRQKTLRLYARSKYGKKYFRHNLFPTSSKNKFKRFLLNTTMGESGGSTMIKNALAQSIVTKMDLEPQVDQPVVVFLNGEYWGIHSMKEYIDKNYISETNDIPTNEVHFPKGIDTAYQETMNFLKMNDLSFQENYIYIEDKIDINNLIDYALAELFFANLDWQGNHTKVWKTHSPDSKWRWILYDLDWAFIDYDQNMLSHLTSWPDSIKTSPNTFGFIFRKLIRNTYFKERFISRYTELLKYHFNVELMLSKLNAIANAYEPEVERHISRWNSPESYSGWRSLIDDKLTTFFKERPCIVETHLQSYFSLKNLNFDCTWDYLTIRNFELYPNPTNGLVNVIINNNGAGAVKSNLEVFSMSGKQVLSKEVFLDENRISFETGSWKPGIYLVILRGRNDVQQAKLIVN